MSELGLRERRRQRTRWAIQGHALQLFAKNGYDATTIEQIAAAAEISPSTFFRYFPSKEDVVILDRYDPVIVEATLGAPARLGPVAALRHGLRQAMGSIPADEWEQVRLRIRLVIEVPALRGRAVDSILSTVDLLAPVLAKRLGPDADQMAARATAGACIGALIGSIGQWPMVKSPAELADLIDLVLAVLDPLPTPRRARR